MWTYTYIGVLYRYYGVYDVCDIYNILYYIICTGARAHTHTHKHAMETYMRSCHTILIGIICSLQRVGDGKSGVGIAAPTAANRSNDLIPHPISVRPISSRVFCSHDGRHRITIFNSTSVFYIIIIVVYS
jgi:hypothetical protein